MQDLHLELLFFLQKQDTFSVYFQMSA